MRRARQLSTECTNPDTIKTSEIQNEFQRFAELAFEIYWKEVESGSKNPLGLLSSK